MDSSKKERWWQKRTFWGALIAVGAKAALRIKGLPEWAEAPIEDVMWSGVALGGYGIAEIFRAKAAALRDHADAKREQVDLLLGRRPAKTIPDGPQEARQ